MQLPGEIIKYCDNQFPERRGKENLYRSKKYKMKKTIHHNSADILLDWKAAVS